MALATISFYNVLLKPTMKLKLFDIYLSVSHLDAFLVAMQDPIVIAITLPVRSCICNLMWPD